MKGIINYIKEHKVAALIIFVVLVALLTHGINLFGYPSYREDEGTYVAQAWSVINQGQLAPYTYWYDHSPVGWILIGLWNFLIGSFTAFGNAINTSRIFMVLLHVASTILLFLIVKRITKRNDAAVIAALLFSITPLGIIFQRRVYLDNIMVFWLILSIFFTTGTIKISKVALSALFFGLAVLSKESAIVFFPVILGSVLYNSKKVNRNFVIAIWLIGAVLLISLYPMLAVLKGEFFPSGTLLGGSSPHVSLLDALKYQSTRSGGFFLSPDSTFQFALNNTWLAVDSFFVIFGVIVSVLNLFVRKKWHIFASALSLIYIAYICYTQALDWYIIPLIPIFSLNIALLYSEVSKVLNKDFAKIPAKLFQYGFVIVLFIATLFQLFSSQVVFSFQQTQNQNEAVSWVKNNLDKNSVILIDNYAFVDLNPNLTDIKNSNTQYYWKADTDPTVKDDILKGNWQNIDYLMVTPAMKDTIYKENMPMVKTAYENSVVVKLFDDYKNSGIDYPVEIRQVNNKSALLKSTWDWYKGYYIDQDGKTIDKYMNNRTTSEGQSYALLRSVYMRDKDTFDKVLNWTNDNLKRKDDHLFSWIYGKNDNGKESVLDPQTASDADEDIALALSFAYRQWDDHKYIEESYNMIQDIWKNEVISVQGTYYLASQTNALRPEGYLINPSYLSPASYRVFAEIDKNHDWTKLASDSYKVLNNQIVTASFDNKDTHLPTNWILLDKDGSVQSAQKYVKDGADDYGFDAFRVMWRTALDAQWYSTPEAINYLSKINGFYENELNKSGDIASIYKVDGGRKVSYRNVSTETGALVSFSERNREYAMKFYNDFFSPNITDNKYWGDKDNYYDQNWGWFGTAFYSNMFPNLWKNPKELDTKLALK